MVKALRRAIDEFIPLGPSVHVRPAQSSVIEAPTDNQGANTSAPDLIIITSWTGALPRHIAKYTQAYGELYPSCPILVVTTSIKDLTLRSAERKHTKLTPAVHYIEKQIAHRTTEHYNILLHAFSEGGSNKATCLAQAFLDHTKYQLPIAAYIYDSTPGRVRFSNNLAAFRKSLPFANRILRFVVMCLAFFFLVAKFLFHKVLVRAEDDILERTRKALNDATLWPIAGIPRTYLFSRADDLIWWQDVESHAEQSAREFGVLSMIVRYESTAHCNHMREDEDYYWNAIRRTWDSRQIDHGSSVGPASYSVGPAPEQTYQPGYSNGYWSQVHLAGSKAGYHLIQ